MGLTEALGCACSLNPTVRFYKIYARQPADTHLDCSGMLSVQGRYCVATVEQEAASMTAKGVGRGSHSSRSSSDHGSGVVEVNR